MKNEKLHLVPQAVIDCAINLSNTKQDNLRLNYIMRLEAIREYCDYVLKTTDQSQTFNNKPKGKYSRIGAGNI